MLATKERNKAFGAIGRKTALAKAASNAKKHKVTFEWSLIRIISARKATETEGPYYRGE